MKWLKSIATDENWDMDGVLFSILFTVALDCLITSYDYFVRHGIFDAEKFGMSVAVILGAGGAGYAAKRVGEKRDAVDPNSNNT